MGRINVWFMVDWRFRQNLPCDTIHIQIFINKCLSLTSVCSCILLTLHVVLVMYEVWLKTSKELGNSLFTACVLFAKIFVPNSWSACPLTYGISCRCLCITSIWKVLDICAMLGLLGHLCKFWCLTSAGKMNSRVMFTPGMWNDQCAIQPKVMYFIKIIMVTFCQPKPWQCVRSFSKKIATYDEQVLWLASWPPNPMRQ